MEWLKSVPRALVIKTLIFFTKLFLFISSFVILLKGTKFDPRNYDREGTETTLCQNWSPNQNKLVMKAKKRD
jgi:hypothetical protein